MRTAAFQSIAVECGFDLAGGARAVPVCPDAQVFLEWVASGMAGRMGYLTDHRAELRMDPRSLLPSARSVLCVGKLYDACKPGAPVSRFAQLPDYHGTMQRDLGRVVERMRVEFGDFEYRICVDTAPLLERSYARLAGLGWIGRNTCLINQELGSWMFLGEILTSLEFEPGVPAPDRCGTCTRCIDACPTSAIIPGGMRTQIDASRCISYLTIELRGEIPEEHRAGMGGHVFGCDICQEVCPWNSQPDCGLAELPEPMTAEEFRARYRETPVWRTRHAGFLRNVAVALGNSGGPEHAGVLEELAGSPDAVVASHARWALARLSART